MTVPDRRPAPPPSRRAALLAVPFLGLTAAAFPAGAARAATPSGASAGRRRPGPTAPAAERHLVLELRAVELLPRPEGAPGAFSAVSAAGPRPVATAAATVTRGYLRSVEHIPDPAGGPPRKTLTPGEITTGLRFEARVASAEGGTAEVDILPNASEMVGPENGFRTFSSGGDTIQLPDVNTFSLNRRVRAKIGGEVAEIDLGNDPQIPWREVRVPETGLAALLPWRGGFRTELRPPMRGRILVRVHEAA